MWKIIRPFLADKHFFKLRDQLIYNKYKEIFDNLLNLQEKSIYIDKLAAYFGESCLKLPFYNQPRYNNILQNFSTPLDLTSFPLIDKPTVGENYEGFINGYLPKIEHVFAQSSGSTGEPIRLSRSLFGSMYDVGLIYLGIKRYLGRDIPSPRLAFINVVDPSITFRRYGYGKDRYFAYDRPIFNGGKGYTFNFLSRDKKRLEEIWNYIIKFKINFLSATPGSFEVFINESKYMGLLQKSSHVIMCVSSGENLTSSHKQLIETSLDVPVMNCYTVGEAGVIGSQSSENSEFYVDNQLVHLEILDQKNNKIIAEGNGPLVVTPYWNLAFPLIRFLTGDIVSLKITGKNKFEKPLWRIENLQGRTINYFISLTGRRFNPALDPKMLLDHGIRQIQFIQEGHDKIRIKYIAQKDQEGIHETMIIERLTKIMEGPVSIKFEECKEITPPHKKHQITVNKFLR